MRAVIRGTMFVVATLAFPMLSTAQQIDSSAAFARLKTLAGTWDVREKGTDRPSTFLYEMTGRGSVLIENAGGMMTAYHLDKGTLVLTHFCGAGNQPRMRVKAVDNDGRHIRFEMYDITNLASPQSYYSNTLDVTFYGDDRVELTYGGTTNGVTSSQTFLLSRRKSATR
jgi:hypothetical protein